MDRRQLLLEDWWMDRYLLFIGGITVSDVGAVGRHFAMAGGPFPQAFIALVASIYRDSSIGNFINIVVVKIDVFRSEQDGPRITNNAAASLSDFCRWQHLNNIADDDDPMHYDTAILITRKAHMRAGGGGYGREVSALLIQVFVALPVVMVGVGAGVVWLAELGTMCDSLRSCSIIEDNGISAAYTIAHELGHVFSLPHDDHKRCVDYLEGKVTDHVMSPTLDHNTSPWTWSKCSAALITKFIDAGSAECLLDRPTSKKYLRKFSAIESLKPGEVYDINKQCDLIFGTGFKVCPFRVKMDCKRLWCTNSKSKSKSCKTLHLPWADGTPCGPGKWCKHSECISKKVLPMVDGNWGKWEDYGDCSRTCGGGIKKGIRKCNSPMPANGGKYCTGRRTRYRSCNTTPCPPGSQDFRELQCSVFNNNLKLQGLPSRVHWVPKYTGIRLKDSCKLYCRVSTSSAYYLLKDKVIDGTKCGPDTFDVCVNGKCRSSGCDNQLGSNVVVDRCGVCGGDNSTCHFERISNSFNLYNLSYALKNISGHFILNGNLTINVARTKVRVKGAWIEYSGSGSMVEQINATGPIGENISLWVLSVGELYPPNIEYTYLINIEANFVWSQLGDWSQCDKTCNGRKFRKIVCVSDDEDRVTVSDKKCERLKLIKPPIIIERCNTHCTLRWEVERDECSARCGEGVAKQKVTCIKQSGWRQEEIDEEECEILGSRPGDLVSCQGDCKPTHWKYDDWSKCTKTCGGGFQTRYAQCMDYLNNELPDKECESNGKVAWRRCNEEPCPIWRAYTWTGCSRTCGPGMRHRKVYCFRGITKVNETECDRKVRPKNTEACNLGDCPRWITSKWEKCSVTCGHGISIRNVQCRSTDGKILQNGLCDPSSRPYDHRKCYMGACTPRRTPKRKLVTTVTSSTTTTPSTTSVTTTTSTTTLATTTKLPVRWQYSDWSACSRSCGDGQTIRQVACFTYNHQRADESKCSAAIKPENLRKCNLGDCPVVARKLDIDIKNGEILTNRASEPSHWRTGPWTKCSASCGGGYQRRQVVCGHGDHGLGDNCDPDEKPEDLQKCNTAPCPSWNTGMWSKCSITCGKDGYQSRRVLCQAGQQILADRHCNNTQRPADRQACNTGPCKTVRRWRVPQWSSCSVTCGKGYQQREVTCIDDDGNEHPKDECPGKKPRVIKRCRMGRCPRWRGGKWSKCSVTCGTGVRTRALKCKSANYRTLDASACDAVRQPRTQKPCNRRPCSDFSWRRGPWSQCSQTCGFGMKFRTVECVNRRGRQYHDDFCNADKKPKNKRRCSEFPCPYIWNTTPWEKCNATCGEGTQTRTVVCQAVTKEGWILPGEVPYGCRRNEKPLGMRRCNLGDCGAPYHWVVGSWGKCSSKCGWGKERRLVMCVDVLGRRGPKRRCVRDQQPESKQRCYGGPCYANSCQELRQKTRIRYDDMYSLLVRGRILQVYCKNMRHDNPAEYIALPTGPSNNYAEIYDRKLRRPNTCPKNGTRLDPCRLCRDKLYSHSGNTSYTKIRVDLKTLTVITNDTTFATSHGRRNIPFGTAGDCYSSQRGCPQGHFSISLIGTGLMVSKNTTWILQGQEASKNIVVSEERQVIRGLCGGYCGTCLPDPLHGLQLDTRHG
ncbi:hypothetical protein FSP39_008871 [Pinctada imbricata]|uniref:Uncharacterized protein n=1 Tax=Pinctada imbricata TaxID=66713 RepID=A0AA88YB79_PINIB|nr:hypothetical protein FSP39_008871 [Pinctada imbricata]